MTRCFLGFELSEASRGYLEALLRPLHGRLAGELGWPLRLVPPRNWHVTLLFFNGLEPTQREAVWAAVEQAVAGGEWSGLAFPWNALSLWPSPRRPGLLCLEAPLFEASRSWSLTGQLDREPFRKGAVEHLRAYRPHITLMRLRRGKGMRLPRPRDWEAVRPELPFIDPARVVVDEVSLFLSTLDARQPIYPRERTLPLDPRGNTNP